MPIYEYKCTTCGFQKEHLQKMSDAPLTTCPECGATSYAKQLSAAGFHLKGGGYYATDFKGGGAKPAESKPAADKSEPAGHACGGGACGACS
jgi:putative FmdB family regulatory protein